MKKTIGLLVCAAGVLLASCTKDDATMVVKPTTATAFSVNLSVPSPESRLTLNESDGALTWSEGDAIGVCVIDNTGKTLQDNCKFVYTKHGDSYDFHGEFHSHPDITEWNTDQYTNCTYFAYYPYTADATATEVLGVIPTRQTGGRVAVGATGGYDNYCKNFDFMVSGLVTASYGETTVGGTTSLVFPTEGINLVFGKSLITIVRLTIPATTQLNEGEKITRVTMAANATDYYMSGSFASDRVYTGYENPFTHVTAKATDRSVYWCSTSEDDYIDPTVGATIYFAVASTDFRPATAVNGIPAQLFRITVHTTNGEAMQTSTGAIKFEAGSLKKLTFKWSGQWSDTISLSANGSANCYVVKPNSRYRFTVAQRGNGITTKYKTAADTYGELSGSFTADEITSFTKAQLIWEVANEDTSANDTNVIDGTPTYDTTGWISFTTGSAEGNAVIAIEKGDSIAWSWHIWSTSDADAIMNGEAIASHTRAMDRNLGAGRAATKSMDEGAVKFQDYGLYYQWGRKDPFIYGFCSPNNGKRYGDGLAWVFSQTATADREYGSIAYSIAHPNAFMARKNTSAKDWYTTSQDISRGNNLWNGGSVNRDDRTDTNIYDLNMDKSMFDPCPKGYRMPVSGIWGRYDNVKTNALGTWYYFNNSYITNVSSSVPTVGGIFIESVSSQDYSFWPSVGALQDNATSFSNKDAGLRYWTASMNSSTKSDNSTNASYYGGSIYVISTTCEPYNFAPKADIRPVRCIQNDYVVNHLYRD